MFGVVIHNKVAWTVDSDCPNSFCYNGGWYVWEKDFETAKEFMIKKYGGK